MKLVNRTVYVSPSKVSEIMPLLGESLLLYDCIALDITLVGTFDVLMANINAKTMEYLLDTGILKFVYNEWFPVIACPGNRNTLALINFGDDHRNIVIHQEELKKRLKLYPSSLINKILGSIAPTHIDRELLLDNCYADLKNQGYIESIFEFVQQEFNLPNFEVEIEGNSCYFRSRNGKKDEKRIAEEASYGLQLMAEINCRMHILNQFDDVICEKEFETFFIKKLKHSFREYAHEDYSRNFVELSEINNFPDIKEVISSRLFTIEDIIKLRKGEGQLLRIWLDKVTKNCTNERVAFSKECAKILSNATNGLALPGRTVVFGVLQTLAQLIPTAESLIISAASEFIVPKLVSEWQPRFFFDKARKIYVNKNKVCG